MFEIKLKAVRGRWSEGIQIRHECSCRARWWMLSAPGRILAKSADHLDFRKGNVVSFVISHSLLDAHVDLLRRWCVNSGGFGGAGGNARVALKECHPSTRIYISSSNVMVNSGVTCSERQVEREDRVGLENVPRCTVAAELHCSTPQQVPSTVLGNRSAISGHGYPQSPHPFKEI
ncbi:uncharacterized protein A4U43_C04F16020 [Asparagus officinalis]|uniref:Uncharacterized protein n=1 Tax=Asparagus officinalis TaxID=4686 RepID=A0A5P1F179_ASPOF|nr:uncharacterized protein A4U43_C04F16020 [Asparagus officinalis]